MNATVARCALIVVFGVIVVTAITQPAWLGDSNLFLKNFVGTEALNVFGVILAISLASAAQLHLEFNKIEERHGKQFLFRTRRAVALSAYSLITIFTIIVIIVCVKHVIASGERSEALINGFCIWMLFWNVLILIDLTQAAFGIPPKIGDGSGE